MSRYKDQLKQNLSQVKILGDRALSIGNHVDDKKYMPHVVFKEWLTLDVNQDFKPDIIWDMNKAMVDEELQIPERYLEYFDHVFAYNLWEYIYDPITAHRNIMDLLKPGGVYMGNYPFVYPQHLPVGMDYLRYTPEGVEKILKTVGFQIESHEFVYGNETILFFYQEDGMKARANADHEIIGSIIKARKI